MTRIEKPNFYQRILYFQFFIILFLFIFLSCNSNNNSQYLTKSTDALSVNVTQVSHVNFEWFKCERGTYGLGREDFKGNLFPIEITIRNNSDSVLHFWEMTCSWQMNYIFSDTTISFLWPGCDGNYPTTITIEPRKVYSHKCFINSEHPINEIINREIKVGFILVRKEDYVFTSDYHELLIKKRSSQQNLIWSNSFKLN
jgi:hypothetical protein